MGAVATESTAAIDALEEIYRFREPGDVRAYLYDHPDLFAPLLDGASQIPMSLPVDEPMILEVAWDPEDEDDDGVLFALVSSRLEPEEVRPHLDRLRRAWLVPVFRRTGGRLNVGIEYR